MTALLPPSPLQASRVAHLRSSRYLQKRKMLFTTSCYVLSHCREELLSILRPFVYFQPIPSVLEVELSSPYRFAAKQTKCRKLNNSSLRCKAKLDRRKHHMETSLHFSGESGGSCTRAAPEQTRFSKTKSVPAKWVRRKAPDISFCQNYLASFRPARRYTYARRVRIHLTVQRQADPSNAQELTALQQYSKLHVAAAQRGPALHVPPLCLFSTFPERFGGGTSVPFSTRCKVDKVSREYAIGQKLSLRLADKAVTSKELDHGEENEQC